VGPDATPTEARHAIDAIAHRKEKPMREIEKLKAEYKKAKKCVDMTGICDKKCAECVYRTDRSLIQLEMEMTYIQARDIPLNRHGEICDAERDGRLVVLPCKVGNMVWRVIHHCTESEFGDCIGCYRMESGRCKPWMFEQKFSVGLCNEIGKTVFLTREEAESAKEESK
jgi:hypothetical protein